MIDNKICINTLFETDYTQNTIYCPYLYLFIGIYLESYFFLGIGSCLGGLSLKYCNSRLITSETGLACSSPIISRNLRIDSVVRNAINSDRFSFINRLQCNTLYLDNKI